MALYDRFAVVKVEPDYGYWPSDWPNTGDGFEDGFVGIYSRSVRPRFDNNPIVDDTFEWWIQQDAARGPPRITYSQEFSPRPGRFMHALFRMFGSHQMEVADSSTPTYVRLITDGDTDFDNKVRSTSLSDQVVSNSSGEQYLYVHGYNLKELRGESTFKGTTNYAKSLAVFIQDNDMQVALRGVLPNRLEIRAENRDFITFALDFIAGGFMHKPSISVDDTNFDAADVADGKYHIKARPAAFYNAYLWLYNSSTGEMELLPAKSCTITIDRGIADDTFFLGSINLGRFGTGSQDGIFPDQRRTEITGNMVLPHDAVAYVYETLYGTSTPSADQMIGACDELVKAGIVLDIVFCKPRGANWSGVSDDKWLPKIRFVGQASIYESTEWEYRSRDPIDRTINFRILRDFAAFVQDRYWDWSAKYESTDDMFDGSVSEPTW